METTPNGIILPEPSNIITNTKTSNSKNDLDGMVRDILAHPENDLSYLDKDVFDSDLFTQSELVSLRNAFWKIFGECGGDEAKKAQLLKNQYKILFTEKIPSPEDFIKDSKYIGSTVDDIYPHNKTLFCDFLNSREKSTLVLTPATGAGKSWLSSLIVFYFINLFYHCRDLKKFLGLAKSSQVSMVFFSPTVTKVEEVLGETLLTMFENSDKLHRVKQLEHLKNSCKSDPKGKQIHWSTAGSTNYMTIGHHTNRINLKITSSLNRLLGLNLTTLVCSELNFAGTEFDMTPEVAFKAFSKGRQRIYGRLHGHWCGKTILDSSPEDRSPHRPLENYIWNGEGDKDPQNMIVRGAQWEKPFSEHFEKDYPLYFRENKKFWVFVGSDNIDPCMIETETEAKSFIEQYGVDMVKETPEELRWMCESDLATTLKDFHGIPAGRQDRLISSKRIIENSFVPGLSNIYNYLTLPDDLCPEGLLFEKVLDYDSGALLQQSDQTSEGFENIKNQNCIFTSIDNKNFYFTRCPKAERFIGIDLAEKKDMASISVVHVEKDIKTSEKIFVVDLTIPIYTNPKVGDSINLDAFKYFVSDLMEKANCQIHHVGFDQFQSSPMKQHLKRYGLDPERVSVDLNPNYTLSCVALMSQGRLKMGHNIVIKNNFQSLINSKTKGGKYKIDHVTGTWIDLDNNNWITSKMGFFGKDGTDSLIVALTLADKYSKDISDYLWDDTKEYDIKDVSPVKERLKLEDLKEYEVIESQKVDYESNKELQALEEFTKSKWGIGGRYLIEHTGKGEIDLKNMKKYHKKRGANGGDGWYKT